MYLSNSGHKQFRQTSREDPCQNQFPGATCRKFVFFNIGNENKILIGARCHKTTNHSLIVIFRHKTSHNKIIIVFNNSLFEVPCAYLIINLSQSRFSCICSIGNIGCLRTILRIIILNIRFNVLLSQIKRSACLTMSCSEIFQYLRTGRLHFARSHS